MQQNAKIVFCPAAGQGVLKTFRMPGKVRIILVRHRAAELRRFASAGEGRKRMIRQNRG